METAHTTQRTIVALLAAGISLVLTKPVQADPITFRNTPASSVVSALSRQYGISIVFKSDVNFTQPVSFSVDDIAAPGGRLKAVRRLANSLGMDFQKVYIVSKIEPGTTVPTVKLDNDGPIEFTSTKVPAQEAIQEIAAVDGAMAEISSVVSGSVVFPRRLITASKAAAVVARQTKTVWKAYYGFFQRPGSLARSNSAQPNIAPQAQSVPAPIIDGPAAPLPNAPTVATVPNTDETIIPTAPPVPNGYYGYGNPYAYADPYGYGNPYAYGSPYGYSDPYGSNAYGSNAYGSNAYVSGGYGYPAPNGGVASPGTVYTVGGGAEAVMPGVNAPGFFAPGATVTTVSPTNVTVLPDSPFQGNYGAPVYVNGY